MWGDFYSEMVDGEDLQSHSDAYQRIIALIHIKNNSKAT